MADAEDKRPVPKRVLIVEDNELNMRLLNDVLEAHGYHILKSSQGRPVPELARDFRPHLILMDIQLPDISGLDVCRLLKDEPEMRAIPIVAVTAFAMAGDESKARAVGCDGYLTKPIRIAELLDTVARFTTGVADFDMPLSLRRPDNDQ